MTSRLVGIFACLLLANVVNFFVGAHIDRIQAGFGTELDVLGSTSYTSAAYQRLLSGGPAGEEEKKTIIRPEGKLLAFYNYLREGGNTAYRWWRAEIAPTPTPAFTARALAVAEQTNAVKYLSLLAAILVLLLHFSGLNNEEKWWTPLFYLLLTVGTAALFGGMTAPVFTAICAAAFVLYYGAIRLSLPFYHAEWCRMMRPGLTWCVFLLLSMSLRGHELVDFWFWTSPLYRLLLLTVFFFSLFFHFTIITRVMKNAKMDAYSRVFAYGMPLGLTVLSLGLFLGLYGPIERPALTILNEELLVFPPSIVNGVDPNGPFVLFFAGVALLITAAIGYFIRRIAH